MSWVKKLYDTYEHVFKKEFDSEREGVVLEPYYHKLEKCHLEIVLDAEGSYLTAKKLVKNSGSDKDPKFGGTDTLIQITPKSLTGRTSGPAPYGLSEKIQYLTSKYKDFGGTKKSSIIDAESKGEKSYYDIYRAGLECWCNSEFAHWKARAVLSYIEKNRVIEDLLEEKLLFVDDDSKLISSWPSTEKKQEKPDIFKISGMSDQGGIMIRWSVYKPGIKDSTTWSDRELSESWVAYQQGFNQYDIDDLCIVLGRPSYITSTHPKSIIQTKDAVGAKLISMPTDKGYLTYQGRFTDENQPLKLSFEASQKSHNVLRWLIRRQGKQLTKESALVAWAVSGNPTIQPFSDPDDWDDQIDDLSIVEQREEIIKTAPDHSVDVGRSFAAEFNKKLSGYRSDRVLQPTDSIVVMALDSATPGRMGISYYRDFQPKDYLDNLEQWHLDFAWWQRASKEKQEHGKQKWYLAAPGLWTILHAVYGDIIKSNETLKKNLAERLLPTIIEKRPCPKDIMQRSLARAINRHSYKQDEQWEQNLGVACALYKGYFQRHPKLEQRRTYDMALEANNRSRDYLYGRLLAIAENIEQFALDKADENRATTAARMMQRFADKPFSAWRNIELALQPYIQRLQVGSGGFVYDRKQKLDEVLSLFDSEDFNKDKALNGEFLLGFHCQRLALRQKNEATISE